jgi:hypothetical protein
MGSRSNSNSSIHQATGTHVTPFVIAARSKISVSRQPSVDNETERASVNDDAVGEDGNPLSGDRSPRGNFLNSTRREPHLNAMLSRENAAVPLDPTEVSGSQSSSSTTQAKDQLQSQSQSSANTSGGLTNSNSARAGVDRRAGESVSESGRKGGPSLRSVGRQQNFVGSPRSNTTTQPQASSISEPLQLPSASHPPHHLSASTPAPHGHVRSLSKFTPTATPNRNLVESTTAAVDCKQACFHFVGLFVLFLFPLFPLILSSVRLLNFSEISERWSA